MLTPENDCAEVRKWGSRSRRSWFREQDLICQRQLCFSPVRAGKNGGASSQAPSGFREISHFPETSLAKAALPKSTRASVSTNDLSSFLQGKKWIYKEATKGIQEASEKAAKNLAYRLEALAFLAVDNRPLDTYPAWQEADIWIQLTLVLYLSCARLQAKSSRL